MRPDSLGKGLSGLVSGAGAVFSGLGRLLRDPKLRKLALKPLLITLVLYVGVIVAATFLADDLLDLVWTKPEEGWTLWVWYVLVPIIFTGVLLALALAFLSISSVISSPFYEEMAAEVLRGHALPIQQIGLVRGALQELLRSLVFIGPAIMCAVIGLIPAIGAPFIMIGTVMGWLGLASNAINPALVVTGHDVGDQIAFVFRSLLVMIGVGAIVALSLLIPILGLVSVPASVIGATELYARSIKS